MHTYTFANILAAMGIAALFSSVGGVWTCPSLRDPYCCGDYKPESSGEGAMIGTGCVTAPRNDNCTDNHPVECCMVQYDNVSYYCDSQAKGYATGGQKYSAKLSLRAFFA